MPNPPDDHPLGRALRDGLRAVPVPEPSADFDARVLTALRAPTPWWQRLWEPARPLLLGASCSLLLTLVLLHWTLSAPDAAPFPSPARPAVASTPAHAPSLDAMLDRPGLRAGSLAAAWAAPPPAPPDRRPDPPRHAQAGRRTPLIV